MIRLAAIMACILLLSGCEQGKSYEIRLTYANLSDSYVYPHRVMFNGRIRVAPRELMPCSDSFGLGGLIMTTIPEPPMSVVVEWEHLLSRKTYRARIDLSARGPWWRKMPFRDARGKRMPGPPVLIIEWRAGHKVAAILSASSMGYHKGRIELGEAVGVEIPRPKGGPGLYLTYEDMVAMRRQRRYVSYKPGSVVSYERQYDGQLSPAQRYGCPRRPDGRIDVQRLPDKKLPLLTDLNGQWIACEAYYCEDKSALKKKLFQHDFRYYPPGRYPTYRFKNAPNPKPAW